MASTCSDARHRRHLHCHAVQTHVRLHPPSQTFANLTADQVAGFFLAEVGTFTRYFAEGASSDFFRPRLRCSTRPGRRPLRHVRFQLPEPQPEVVDDGHPRRASQRATVYPRLLRPHQRRVLDGHRVDAADHRRPHDDLGRAGLRQPRRDQHRRPGVTVVSGRGRDDRRLRPLLPDSEPERRRRHRSRCVTCCPRRRRRSSSTYTVAPHSRFNIWVNLEDPALAAAEVSAVIPRTNQVPVIVERAMYLIAGHAAVRRRARERRRRRAGAAVVPRRGRHRAVLRPVRPDRQPQRAGRDGRRALPAADGTVITRTYTVAPQQPVQHLGRLRGARAGQHGHGRRRSASPTACR